MNKADLKEMVEKKGETFIDLCNFDITSIVKSIIERFTQEKKTTIVINFIYNFWGTGILKKIGKDLYQNFLVKNNFNENDYILKEETIIGTISCYGQRLNIVYSGENKCFQYENGQYISKDIQGLFEYLLSDESIQPINILPQTYNILKTLGWYEGRNIDVSKIVNKFKENGISLTDVQIAFLQEFGGIKGKSENRECFEIFIDAEDYQFKKSKPPTKDDMYSYGPLNITGYEEKIDFLLVGAYGNLMVNLWISSDGRIFTDQGQQLGRTIMEAWQTILLD